VNIFLCLHTSATVVAPPNSAYFQEVIPLFSATSCKIRNIDEVVEYYSNRRKRQTMDTIVLQGGGQHVHENFPIFFQETSHDPLLP
jgi:hypothetical protein